MVFLACLGAETLPVWYWRVTWEESFTPAELFSTRPHFVPTTSESSILIQWTRLAMCLSRRISPHDVSFLATGRAVLLHPPDGLALALCG